MRAPQQLLVLRRKCRGRVRLTNGDRLFFVQLYRWFPSVLQVLHRVSPVIGIALSIGAFIFSGFLPTFPGERVEVLTHVPYWTSLHELFFAGAADEVTGQPLHSFSNRLVLTDQTLIDSEKPRKG